MSTRYLVLRANAPIQESVDLTSGSRSRSGRTGGVTGLSVIVEDGRERDAGELRRDPMNAAVMDADTAFSLIEPKARTAVANLDIGMKLMGAQKLPLGLVAVGAHATNLTGQGVRVAVLDTGCDVQHPAFKGKQIAMANFTNEGGVTDVTDSNGHGTHCAGTICGGPVGDVRVGVAPGVTKLAIGKVLGKSGGSLEMLIKGLLWAVIEQKVDVVSMSLGYDLPGNIARLVQRGVPPELAGQAVLQMHADILKGIATLRAFLETQARNVVLVAATGNESKRAQGFVMSASLPAAELFAVGAVGPVDPTGDKWKVAEFSNGRARVVAPGVDVISAAPGGGWASMSGTSMATPHVAGVASLWVEKIRNTGTLSVPDSVRSELQKHTTQAPLVDTDVDAIGEGLVQVPA